MYHLRCYGAQVKTVKEGSVLKDVTVPVEKIVDFLREQVQVICTLTHKIKVVTCFC